MIQIPFVAPFYSRINCMFKYAKISNGRRMGFRLNAYQSNFMPRNCGLPEAMSEHAKPEKGQGDRPGEKHTTDIRGNVGKSVTNASDHKVLEWRRLLNKW